jgi:nucleotide-binding universal stress UspA family protein
MMPAVVLGSGASIQQSARISRGTPTSPCPVTSRARKRVSPRARRGGIVVGVDGSDISDAAMAFAYEEASWRGLGLTVVHAWQMARMPVTFDVPEATREAAEERVLARRWPAGRSIPTSGWDLEAGRITRRGAPREAMGAALRRRLARRGRLRWSRLRHQVVLRHASTSIAIVRNRNRGVDEDRGVQDVMTKDVVSRERHSYKQIAKSCRANQRSSRCRSDAHVRVWCPRPICSLRSTRGRAGGALDLPVLRRHAGGRTLMSVIDDRSCHDRRPHLIGPPGDGPPSGQAAACRRRTRRLVGIVTPRPAQGFLRSDDDAGRKSRPTCLTSPSRSAIGSQRDRCRWCRHA